MVDLGTLGGAGSSAAAINARGQIVGYAATAEGLSHAFRWDPSSRRLVDLGVLPGTVVSAGRDTNDRGQIVGTAADVGDNSSRAFLFDPRAQAMRNLPGIPAGSTEGAAINNRGFVVGRTTTAQGELRAFLWSPLTRRGITLAGLRGADASALDLNDACRMVGTGRGPSGQFAALLWKPTATRS